MAPSKLVVDTNVFFSLLLRRDTVLRRQFLSETTHSFHCPRFFLVELFKHKERIICSAGRLYCSAACRLT